MGERDLGGRRMFPTQAGPRLLDQREGTAGVARRRVGGGPDGQERRPEDGRGRQLLVQAEALLHLRQAGVHATAADSRSALEDEGQRPPDGVVVCLSEALRLLGPSLDRRQVRAPIVQEGGMVEREGLGVRMGQLVGETQPALRASCGRVRQPGRPAQQPGNGVGDDARARPDPELDEVRSHGSEVGGRLVGVLDGGRQVVQPAGAHAPREVRLRQERGIAVVLGDRHQLPRRRRPPLEVSPPQLERCQASQRGESLRDRGGGFQAPQDLDEGPLGVRAEPSDDQLGPGQVGPQRERVVPTLRRLRKPGQCS